jgi:hypothetical protein
VADIHRQNLPLNSYIWRGFGDALAARRSPPCPGNPLGHAAFVEKLQLFRRDRGEGGKERFPPVAVGLSVALVGAQRLFSVLDPFVEGSDCYGSRRNSSRAIAHPIRPRFNAAALSASRHLFLTASVMPPLNRH